MRTWGPASEDGSHRLKNVRLPNISVVPVDPDHFFKPKLAARFGRRTLEVRSALSWLDCGKAMISPLARDLWLGVGRCFLLHTSRAIFAEILMVRLKALDTDACLA